MTLVPVLALRLLPGDFLLEPLEPSAEHRALAACLRWARTVGKLEGKGGFVRVPYVIGKDVKLTVMKEF